jgi:hypothetical protein
MFKWYGRRGITICNEWRDVRNFVQWALANGYTDTLTIDRRDPDGHYCPENCRWVTRLDNIKGRRKKIGPTIGPSAVPVKVTDGFATDVEIYA